MALLTAMHQPLGKHIGNWLEMYQTFQLLQKGGGSACGSHHLCDDLLNVTMALAAQIRIGPEDDPGMLKTRRRLAEMGERAAAPAHSAVGQRRERMIALECLAPSLEHGHERGVGVPIIATPRLLACSKPRNV